mgnify:CR=1 FL=1
MLRSKNSHKIKIYDINKDGLSLPGIEVSTENSSPREMVVVNDKVYFTNWNTSDVKVFNLFNYTIEKSIPVGALPEGMTTDGTFIWVANSGGTTVSNLDFKIGFDSIHPIGVITVIEPIKLSTSFIKAYPNPFSTSTTIELEINEESDVEINVFNLLGEKVEELNNSKLYNGVHKFKFNAKFKSNGIYFVKIRINGEQEVLKLIQQ